MNIQSDEVSYFFSVEARNRETNYPRKIQGVIISLPINQDNFSDFKKTIENDWHVTDVEFLALNRL
jgi:hypothetical protein